MTTPKEAYAALERALASTQGSFYRDFYAVHGFAATRLHAASEWHKVPLLSKADIIAAPLSRRLLAPIHRAGVVRFTSGTSGIGITIMPRRLPAPSLPGEMRYGGVALMTFFYYSFSQACARGSAPQRIIAGDRKELRASARIAAEAGVDALKGSSSVLIAFAPHLEKEGMLAHIRHISHGEERLSALQQETLQRYYHNAQITSVYASAEAGEVARTAAHAPRSTLLEPFPHFFIELLQGDKAYALSDADGMEGELVLTALLPDIFPLIRYRTGDRARAVRVQDKMLIEMLGRSAEDRVRILGGEILLAELERAVRHESGEQILDFAAAVDEEKSADGSPITTLTVTLFVSDPERMPLSAHEAGERLAAQLRVNQQRSYADGVSSGLYAPLSCVFELLLPGSAKHKPLRDMRK